MFLFELLGGLALTVLGIKFVSESLEKFASNRVKQILTVMTANHYSSVAAGFALALMIHSSSATSTLVVSFVNAGIFDSVRALGIILGAGAGSSLSPLLISISRLGIDITYIAFLMLFAGLSLGFIKKEKMAIAGNICIGFSLIFVGMWIMEESLIRDDLPINLYFDLAAASPVFFYAAAVLLIFTGALSTFLLRNSLGPIALFMVAVNQGFMDTKAGICVVLGCSLGRAFIQIYASQRGNPHAKKTAAAYGVLICAGIVLFMVPPVLNVFTWLSVTLAYMLPVELYVHSYSGLTLAVFNTLYNVTITLLFFWLLPFYMKVFDRFFKDSGEKYSLIHLNTGLIKTPDLALIEVQQRVIKMGAKSYKLFKRTFDLFFIKKSMYSVYLDEIKSLQEGVAAYEADITAFLIELMQGDTSSVSAGRINNFMEQIKNLQWIGENCRTLGRLLSRAAEQKYSLFNKRNESEFNSMLQNLDLFYSLIINNLAHMSHEAILEEGKEYENQINLLYKKLRNINIAEMGRDKKNRKKNIQGGLLFMEIIKTIELIGDSLENILYLYIYSE